MGSNVLKIMSVLLVTIFTSLIAQAEGLTFGEGSPAQYFQQNPGEAVRFMEQVEANPELTDAQKKSYKALLGLSSEMAGDEVLESLDTSELAWFYGWDQQQSVASSDATVHQAAKITSEPGDAEFQDCLSRAMCVMVSKASQRIYAFIDGQQIYLNDAGRDQENPQPWARVSTARPGKWTPNGFFTVQELAHAGRVSSLYSGAALYYAMQINGHIFIHATSPGNYSDLGGPASAGCIRTRFGVSEQLNLTMRDIGGRTSGVLADPSSVRVIVGDSIPDNYLQAY